MSCEGNTKFNKISTSECILRVQAENTWLMKTEAQKGNQQAIADEPATSQAKKTEIHACSGLPLAAAHHSHHCSIIPQQEVKGREKIRWKKFNLFSSSHQQRMSNHFLISRASGGIAVIYQRQM